MTWRAVATTALCACSLTQEWRARAAQPVAPATTIARQPTAKTFALVPAPGPDPGCPVADNGVREGDQNPKISIYRLCFPGLRTQFEHAVTALLSGLLTPGDSNPDYVARVSDFQLHTGNGEHRGARPYHYEIQWDVELLDRRGAVIVDIKDVTGVAGGAGGYEPASDELDTGLAQSLFTAEGSILDAIRTAVLASSAVQ
jgi:hypothetical protein